MTNLTTTTQSVLKPIFLSLILLSSFFGISQETPIISEDDIEKKKEKMFTELSENACKCIDSIEVYNKDKEIVTKEVTACINKASSAFQMGKIMFDIMASSLTNDTLKKKNSFQINVNEDSPELKEIYYDMERSLMQTCPSIKSKIAADEKQSYHSMTSNPEALELYNKGVGESENGNYKEAIKLLEKAVKIDPKFAFAWDNLGVCYRKTENYDKAIKAYETSLEIDPYGSVPLQNIAIVYQYAKEYDKAIKSYERLAKLDKNNPEIYYGIGLIYAANLNDYEKGLDNMCKAYNLYVEQKSPYRSDAEKLIQQIYSAMKKNGKEDRFNEILKQHNITPN